MLSILSLCLFGTVCSAFGTVDHPGPDDYNPAPFEYPPKQRDVISSRSHMGFSFSGPLSSHQMELGAAKRSSGQSKRQQFSGTPSCNPNTFMCRKTHHPLCLVSHIRSRTGDTCATKVICDQDASNYSQSAVCYAVDKAFTLPVQTDLRVYDRVMFNYTVRLIDENEEQLPYRLQGINSTNVAPGHVLSFIEGFKERINITQFKIRSRYHCRDVSMCRIGNTPSALL